MSLNLAPPCVEDLEIYYRAPHEWNGKINLTAFELVARR